MKYKNMELYEFNKAFNVQYGKKLSAIYKITNLKNGRYYFGKSENVKSRWSSHINDLLKNKHANPELQKDFNFYDRDLDIFDFTIQKKCPNKFDLPYEELKSIYKHKEDEKLYNCLKPQEEEYLRIGNFLKEENIQFHMLYLLQYCIYDFVLYKKNKKSCDWSNLWKVIIFDNSNNKTEKYRDKLEEKTCIIEYWYKKYEVIDIAKGYPTNEELSDCFWL
jgi:hypothetical protein